MFVEKDQMIVCDICQIVKEEDAEPCLLQVRPIVIHSAVHRPGSYNPENRIDLCSRCYDRLEREMRAQRRRIRDRRGPNTVLDPILAKLPEVYYNLPGVSGVKDALNTAKGQG